MSKDPPRTDIEREYFCRSCRHLVKIPAGVEDLRACPVKGCANPNGFGRFADTPKPPGSVAVPRGVVVKPFHLYGS